MRASLIESILYTISPEAERGNGRIPSSWAPGRSSAVPDQCDELGGRVGEGGMRGGEPGQVEGPFENPGVVEPGGAVVLAGRLGRLDGEDLDPLFCDQPGFAVRRHLGGLDLLDLFLHPVLLFFERERGPGEIDA